MLQSSFAVQYLYLLGSFKVAKMTGHDVCLYMFHFSLKLYWEVFEW